MEMSRTKGITNPIVRGRGKEGAILGIMRGELEAKRAGIFGQWGAQYFLSVAN